MSDGIKKCFKDIDKYKIEIDKNINEIIKYAKNLVPDDILIVDNSLEQQLKEAQDKLKHYETGFKGACTTCESVGEINLKLNEKLNVAVDALEFYGDKGNWYYSEFQGDNDTELEKGGKTARKALEKIKGM